MPDRQRDKRVLTRRQAIGTVGAIAVGSVARSMRAQAPATAVAPARPADPSSSPLAPRAELVNTLEYEAQAKRKLAPAIYTRIAGGDRAAFDRITLRPRMMVPVLDMDLSLTLFGETHFAPIIAGPIGDQARFHANGELATVKGTSGAKTAMVVSSASGVPLAQLVAAATTPLWYQVFASDPAAPTQMQQAINAGCKVICVTVGAPPSLRSGQAAATITATDWAIIASLKRRATVPVIIKGITTPAAARLAMQSGADGIVVSNYGGQAGPDKGSPVLALAGIVDAVSGKVPVLTDGSIRRGTDILKALAFGAQAVLVGRPVMWGLAAYGADGVQGVLEMLQTELARYMGMCGKETLKALDRTLVKVHSQA